MKFIIGLVASGKPHFIENLMKKKICNVGNRITKYLHYRRKNYKRNYLIYIIIIKILI